MNITKYINRHWSSKTGLYVTVRRESDKRKFDLYIPPSNKWNVWSWSKTRLVINAQGRRCKATRYDVIYDGWRKIKNRALVDYLFDFEPVD
tara:strand:- start:1151 stop:1423 length:273 start_codon:yes stop_codon:yes gene_type:complete